MVKFARIEKERVKVEMRYLADVVKERVDNSNVRRELGSRYFCPGQFAVRKLGKSSFRNSRAKLADVRSWKNYAANQQVSMLGLARLVSVDVAELSKFRMGGIKAHVWQYCLSK
jgi:hypothetical protein